jgi:hypothetical protein
MFLIINLIFLGLTYFTLPYVYVFVLTTLPYQPSEFWLLEHPILIPLLYSVQLVLPYFLTKGKAAKYIPTSYFSRTLLFRKQNIKRFNNRKEKIQHHL